MWTEACHWSRDRKMKTVTIWDELEHIILKNGDWECRIVPAYGMNTLSLSRKGNEILRTPKNLKEFLSIPEAYGTPPLMPANRTRDGRFSFEGKEYSLPINDRFHCHKHGLLHVSPFQIVSRKDNYVKGCFSNSGEVFPFPFRAETECTLNDGYEQLYRFSNTGNGNMPLIFAIHAAFRRPESAMIPIKSVWNADSQCLPVGIPQEPEGVILDYMYGKELPDEPSEEVGVCCESGGQAAVLGEYCYRVSDNFTQWIVWNGDGNQGFLCVEPQSAPSNALNSKRDLIVLKPGETIEFRTEIISKKSAGE